MVLYHVSTTYQLLYSIVHKLTYHEHEESELLMIEYIRPQNERDDFRKKLLDFGFFTRVRYVPERQFKLQKGVALNEQSPESQIKSVIENSCRAFINWFREDVRAYDKLYVASDQHAFGVYLVNNKIPYIYMEDASGMLSEHERYLFITKRNNLTDYVVSQYLGGAGENAMISAKLCDLSNQLEGFSDPLAVDFSIYNALKNLIPEKTGVILKFFGNMTEAISSDKKICLFLTQDLNTLKIKDLDLQEMTVTMVADYMCPDHMQVIKPHPKDRWQNYRRIFPNAAILSKDVPSELLPFAIKGDIDTALTVSSTSIRGMVNSVKHSYYFTTEAESYPERLNSMYAAAELLKYLGIKSGAAMQNINEIQMRNFLECNGIAEGCGEALIDGGVEKNDAVDFKSNRITVCLSLGNVLNYSPKWYNENMYLVTAAYKPMQDSLMPESEYLLLVYCEDPTLCKQIIGLDIEKNLFYSRADVRISGKKLDKATIDRLNARLQRDLEWEELHEKENRSIRAAEAEKSKTSGQEHQTV